MNETLRIKIEVLVQAAQNGDKQALEQVVSYAQGYVYNLALRMLQRPVDAEDATQEIMIKLITHLGQFRHQSAFSTWMYRIAQNTLLNLHQRNPQHRHISFEDISERIELSLAQHSSSPEETVVDAQLSEEVRRSCTLGMLYALGHEDRMALILGEILQVESDEAADIMQVTATAYRQRLSRARRTLVAFVSTQCGIINPDSPCRCYKHIVSKRAVGSMETGTLHSKQPHDMQSTDALLCASSAHVDPVQRSLALFRAHPVYANPADLHDLISLMFSAGDPDA